ncbi:YkvA family protein [Ramlibacter sp. AN1015]|uniref:YkvA family protein n=1 Tax=Ramlibacter sp. AN1015 TaxID=3133428 RepID=UPI0030C63F1A
MWKRFFVLWRVVRGDALQFWRALRHPQSPGWFKLASVLLVLYLISPADLIPDVIPVLGVVDDLVLLPLAIRWLLDRLPPEVARSISAGGRRA